MGKNGKKTMDEGGRMNIRLVTFFVLLLIVVSVGGVDAQSDWKKQWEATVEAGRKEGEVVIYGPHNPAYQQIWAIFQKSYPEVKFTFVPGKGSDHAQRIVAERRAGKYLADLMMGGSSTYASFTPGILEPLKPLLILPDVIDLTGIGAARRLPAELRPASSARGQMASFTLRLV